MSETAPKKRKRGKHRIRKLIILLLILILLAGAGYLTWMKLKHEYTVVYNPYTAVTGSISNSLSFSGNLSLIDSKTYSAAASGTVRNLYVSAGDKVSKGDRLIRLSNGESYTADFDGTVNRVDVEKGDEVSAGASLLQIADFDRMKVSLRVDEYDISDVAVGQTCNVTVTATGAKFESVISAIDHISSSQGSVAYYAATVYVDANGAANVYPGMQVTASIPKEEALDVVVLKMDALSFDRTNQAFVYKEDAGTGEMAQSPVTVGVSNGNYVEIVSGVESGETVYAVAKQEEEASIFASLFSTPQINQPQGGRNGTQNRQYNNNNRTSNPSQGGGPGGGF